MQFVKKSAQGISASHQTAKKAFEFPAGFVPWLFLESRGYVFAPRGMFPGCGNFDAQEDGCGTLW
jgi:hypothetical protein